MISYLLLLQMNTPSPDCFVLKFEEFDYKTKTIDNTLYLIFDKQTNKFIIRGKRADLTDLPSCTYSYECSNENALYDFIKYMICNTNVVNEILYNYDNLPLESKDITFEFLEKHSTKDYEISGYNNIKIKEKRMKKIFKILKYVFNIYY